MAENRCANATTAHGLHVLLIPEELAVQRVAYRVQILQAQVVNLIAASGGILAQFGGSSARPPVIGVAPLARDSIQGFFGCSQGSRSAWKGY